MNVRTEIKKYGAEADKPVLDWLFNRYHWESQWSFVATCTHERDGTQSWQSHRAWAPTAEGRILYEHAQNKNAPNNHGGL